jgi:GntR family histidine utilization transcriptional repressor
MTSEPKTAQASTLYRRIRSEIEDNIISGRWPPGHRVPFEHELVEQFSCSRMTVNRVMSDLASAGLVERKRKTGSVVARPKVQQALLDVPDLKAEVEGSGERYGYELLSRQRLLARRLDAERIGVSLKTPLLALRCRHSRGGTPFAIEDRLLNLAEIPEAEQQDFSVTPPNTWLVGQIPWTEAEHRIAASNADAEMAALLGIEIGTACLNLSRRTWRGADSITAVTITHPGDSYQLFARFAPSKR